MYYYMYVWLIMMLPPFRGLDSSQLFKRHGTAVVVPLNFHLENPQKTSVDQRSRLPLRWDTNELAWILLGFSPAKSSSKFGFSLANEATSRWDHPSWSELKCYFEKCPRDRWNVSWHYALLERFVGFRAISCQLWVLDGWFWNMNHPTETLPVWNQRG